MIWTTRAVVSTRHRPERPAGERLIKDVSPLENIEKTVEDMVFHGVQIGFMWFKMVCFIWCNRDKNGV